jgi:hypothetical protein
MHASLDCTVQAEPNGGIDVANRVQLKLITRPKNRENLPDGRSRRRKSRWFGDRSVLRIGENLIDVAKIE